MQTPAHQAGRLRNMDESGQTMSEYALVLGLIVLVTVVVFIALGDAASTSVTTTAQRFLPFI